MNTYAVDIQAAAASLPSTSLSPRRKASDGFDRAEHRAIRRAVQRAGEWNAENAGGNLPRRPEGKRELLWWVISDRCNVLICDARGALMDSEHGLFTSGTTAVAGNVSTTILAAGAQR